MPVKHTFSDITFVFFFQFMSLFQSCRYYFRFFFFTFSDKYFVFSTLNQHQHPLSLHGHYLSQHHFTKIDLLKLGNQEKHHHLNGVSVGIENDKYCMLLSVDFSPFSTQLHMCQAQK